MHRTIDGYTCLTTLGKGGQADIFLAQDEKGYKVALKVFDWSNSTDQAQKMECIGKEVQALKRLTDP